MNNRIMLALGCLIPFAATVAHADPMPDPQDVADEFPVDGDVRERDQYVRSVMRTASEWDDTAQLAEWLGALADAGPDGELADGVWSALERAGRGDLALAFARAQGVPALAVPLQAGARDVFVALRPWDVYGAEAQGWPLDTHLTRDQVASSGLVVGDSWWMLPAEGPGVPARVLGVGLSVTNESGGMVALGVWLRGVGPGEYIAVSQGPPPASWVAAEPTRPSVADAQRWAEAVAPGQAAVSGWQQWPEGAARVLRSEAPVTLPSGEFGAHTVELVAEADGRVWIRVDELGPRIDGDVGWPAAGRDVDGDGLMDMAWSGCAPGLQLSGGRALGAPDGCSGC